MQIKSNANYANSGDMLNNSRVNPTRNNSSSFADHWKRAQSTSETQDSSATDAPSPPPASPPVDSGGGNRYVTPDYFSFGDAEAMALPKGTSRLEYNVYRMDGLNIDATTYPFIVKSTGERLDAATSAKYQKILFDVTKQRIQVYKDGKASGQSDEQILAALHRLDNDLPAAYHALIGKSTMVATDTRYDMPTFEEMAIG